jgi:uncharacterized protein YfaS (alpha-2-macroglobulin family)
MLYSLWRLLGRSLTAALIASLAFGSLSTTQGQPSNTAAPRVIASSPAQREVVGPEAAIRITFDQPMNRASVESAFSIQPTVNGALSWQDDSTLIFTPGAALVRGAEYRIVIGVGAQSATGIALEDPFRLTFQIAPSLSISQVIPVNGTDSVNPDAAITVIFDRPVVPLVVSGEQPNLPQPLTFDPPVRGKGEWVGTAMYIFRPETVFAGGTLYTASIAAGLKDVDGSALEAPYSWQFRTANPMILSVLPVDGFNRALLDQEVRVQFNQPMDLGSLQRAFTLRNLTTGADVAGSLSLDGSKKQLTFKPAARLSIGTAYRFTLTAEARGADGQSAITNPQGATFTTVPLPAVVNTYPANGETVPPGTGVSINFNTSINRETFAGRVKVSPDVKNLTLSPGGSTLYINFQSLPETKYTITLEAGVEDIYGNAIRTPYTFSFTTGSLDPILSVGITPPITVTNAYKPSTTVLASSINVNTINALLARVDLPDLLRISTSYGEPDFRLFAGGTRLREWQIPTNTGRNLRADTTITLAEDGKALPVGVYYLRLDSPEFVRFLRPPIQQPIQRFIVVANAALLMKVGPKETLVWATDMQSGQPLPNLQVFLYRGNVGLGAAYTDGNGVARFSAGFAVNSNERLWAVASGEGRFGLLNQRWNNYNFEPGGFDVPAESTATKQVAYLYTDQPIYRPGRPVYFRGILRDQDDVTFTVPANQPIQVQIYNPEGQILYDKSVTLNAFGAFSGQIDLANDARLGQYSIQVQYRGQYAGYLGFQVAEFRPPEFLTTVAADKERYADGDPITATIDAKFLFGGAVSGGRVEWNVVANPGFFAYPLPFIFGIDYAYGRGAYFQPRTVASGSGVLDSKGQLKITFPADLGDQKVQQGFTIEATVYDVSNQAVSGRVEVTVFPAEVLVGLKPDKYVGRAGEPVNIEITTTDWDAAPVAGQAVTAKATLRRWEQDPTTLRWEVKETLAAEERLTTDEKGLTTFTFTPSEGGVYEISAETRDQRERIAKSTFTLWVSGRGGASWGRDEKRLTLIADKRGAYKPGETATILIPSPYSGPVKALITVERAGIMTAEIVEIDGSYTYTLPIEAIHAPNVYVSAVVMRGSGPEAKQLPEMQMGLISLEVEVQQQLRVTLTPSTRRAKPGEKVAFDVLTTDLSGKPISAEVGLHLSDVATLSVGAPNSGPIFSAFWATRPLSVFTYTMLSRLTDGLTFDEIYLRGAELAEAVAMAAPPAMATMTMGAADGIAAPGAAKESRGLPDTGGGGNAAIPAPRTNFVDTPLWKADLVTDAEGKGRVEVALPDNLTTWRLDARAISLETYVGSALTEIIATLPLLVRPATPRFFVVGDEVELAVVVNNNTESDLEAVVSLTAKGVTLRASADQTVKIARDGRTRVTWLATVQDVESVDLTFAAVSGEFADASKPAVGIGPDRLLPVYRYLAPDYVGTAGVLRVPGSRTEGIVLPPQNLAPEGTLTVNLSHSLAAVTLDGLKVLKNFPYQCLEQTVSRFLPNAVTYRALQRLGQDSPALRADLEVAVKQALTRLQSEQKPDGGWGWYVTEESNPLTTAYALLGLIEARDADFQIPPDMINRAQGYLLGQIPAISQNTQPYILNRAAFTLFVLARSGAPNINAMDDLMRWRDKLALYARAFLAQAYDYSRNATGFQDRIDTLLADINSAAIVSGTGVHWEETSRDWWNWGSDTRSTAILLGLLVKFTPQSELIPNVVRWLMVARKGDAWENTQETAWAVMSLTAWMEASGELKADYAYSVSLNDREIGAGRANRDNLRETKALTVSVAEMLREQVNRLTFNHGAGDGSLYYTAQLMAKQPVEAIQPTDRGLKFSRTYLIDGKPVTEAKVGDVITVSLEITTSRDLYYVVINDPIPAGTEALDRSLQTTANIGQQPELIRQGDDWWRWGWGWWYFSDTQLKTEKAVLSASYLPRGTYRYVYEVQATTPGTFRVIPPHGNEFYFPEVFGRGAGSLFIVRP